MELGDNLSEGPLPDSGVVVYPIVETPQQTATLNARIRNYASKLIQEADKRRRIAARDIYRARIERGSIPGAY